MNHEYDANEEDERHDAEVQRRIDDCEDALAAKRAASGTSKELLSLKDAYAEGVKAGGIGLGAAMNPYQDTVPEHREWNRGRLAALGLSLTRQRSA